MESSSSQVQHYRRFFAILVSVLPGLNLILGVGAFFLWLIADIIEAEWGWGIGVAAIFMAIVLVVWVFVGPMIRAWADNKATPMLIGLCSPFILIDAILAGALFEMSVLRQFFLTQEQREAGESVDLGTVLGIELGGPILIVFAGLVMWGIAQAVDSMTSKGEQDPV